jgi:hypothetical protein
MKPKMAVLALAFSLVISLHLRLILLVASLTTELTFRQNKKRHLGDQHKK